MNYKITPINDQEYELIFNFFDYSMRVTGDQLGVNVMFYVAILMPIFSLLLGLAIFILLIKTLFFN